MTDQKQSPVPVDISRERIERLKSLDCADYLHMALLDEVDAAIKQRDKLDRQVRAWMKACDIRRESGEKLSRENRELEIRALKAEAERDELAAKVEGLKVARDMMGRLWGRAKDERDQALAASAAREIAMRDRAAEVLRPFASMVDKNTCKITVIWEEGNYKSTYTDVLKPADFDKARNALPLSPDGQQALDDERADAWDDGYECRRTSQRRVNPHRTQPSRSSDAVKSEDKS